MSYAVSYKCSIDSYSNRHRVIVQADDDRDAVKQALKQIPAAHRYWRSMKIEEKS